MPGTLSHYQFAIDFSPVRNIPEDPKERLPYFNTFKLLLEQEREKIKAWHRSGAGGREVIQVHTSLIDEVIRNIIIPLSSHKTYSRVPVLDEFSLIAVGGYGRGELNPHSDIDLLFLQPKNVRRTTDLFIKDVTSILWGIGLEIGQSCRTLKECLELAESDLTIKTSMIETRFLIGNASKYETFSQSIRKNIFTRNVHVFLKAKSEEKAIRHAKAEGIAGNPEPNIKEGPGGLRDYHTALWAVAVRFGCLSFREIGDEDVISQQELDELDLSVDFCLRVRNELHYLKEKKSDVLSLELQKDLAANLGYRTGTAVESVENFMRDYFLHATTIHDVSETIFERCLERKRPIRKIISSLKKKPLTHGFSYVDSTLALDDDANDPFKENPELLLTLFEWCREHNLTPDHRLQRKARLNNHLLDDEFLKQAPLKKFLFSILGDPHAEKHLRLMHKLGILDRLLPEFGHSHCRVKYDFYHRYTADEHSLRIVQFLEELGSDSEKNFWELTTVYSETPSQVLLKFSALLLSIGTNHNGATLESRAELLSRIADRWNLDAEEKETVFFLLENLYEMVETAIHQDIHQPAVIQGFAQKTGSPERLALLYLFSYAELRAVAPGTWNSWKKVLMSELYHRTTDYFMNPESLQQKPQATQDLVHKELQWEVPASEIQTHLNLLPKDYLVTAHPGEIALHIRLIRSIKDKLFILNHHYNEEGGFHNLILCCPAKLEAFKKMVGSLTAKNMNILGAQIYLRKDGLVIVSVQVEADERLGPENMEIWKEVKTVLRDILEGRKDLRELLASRTRYVAEKKHAGAIIPKISIDNTHESNYTIIRIEARDHIGMLYKIAAVFADFSIQIHRAKISTQGGRGIDVFYVSLKDQKVTFNKLLRRIKEHLIHAMLTENPEDI